jgi:hypothetical protein
MNNTNNKNGENKNPMETNILLSNLDYKTSLYLISNINKIFSHTCKQEETTFKKKELDTSDINELIKNFHSHLNLQNIFLKAEKLMIKEKEKEKGNKKNHYNPELMIFIKIIKAYVIIHTWKINLSSQYINQYMNYDKSGNNNPTNKFYKSSQEKIIFSKLNVNEISYNIFSLFLDEYSYNSYSSINENSNDLNPNSTTSLDMFINLLLSTLLGENTNFKYIVSIIEKNSNSENYSSSTVNSTSIQNFEIFNYYFKYVLLFLHYSDKFNEIFDVLDKDKKSKILTVEFIVCGKKLKRSFEEGNIINTILTRMIELLDTNEVYITKTQFFNNLLNSIVNF